MANLLLSKMTLTCKKENSIFPICGSSDLVFNRTFLVMNGVRKVKKHLDILVNMFDGVLTQNP